MSMLIFNPFHRSRAFYERDLLDMDPFHHYNCLRLRLRREMEDLLAQNPQVVSKDGVGGGGNNDFQVKLDVGHFAPEEVSVKILENTVIIEGKHDEKQDEQGYIYRHFIRRYTIPNDVKPESITCNLHSDGVLEINAPRAVEGQKSNERHLPINFTGQPSAQANAISNGVDHHQTNGGKDPVE